MKKRVVYFSVLVFVLTLNSLSVGALTADPDSFNIVTKEGCKAVRTLTIHNSGTTALDYLVRTRQVHDQQAVSENPRVEDVNATAIPKIIDLAIDQNIPYKKGELIVRFGNKRTGLRPNSAKKMQMVSKFGAKLKKEFDLVPGMSVVKLAEGVSVADAVKQFNKSEDVIYAQPNYEVHALATIPNDTLFNQLWGMNNTGQSGGTADADIDAPEAWDISTGSQDIVVAVIDTGIDYTHPDLAANIWVNQAEKNGLPGVDDDGNGYVDDIYGYDFCNNDGDPMDDHYHGTHCAGTIGAIGNNNQGVAGVCWHVKIMALKFLNSAGSGSTSDAIEAVQYSILMGAKLSSNSWGGGGYSQALKDAIDAAGAAGMLFVAAAGNDSSDTDIYTNYPSCYPSDSIIAVMATDSSDHKSSFSNYGATTVDIGAPGSSIMSCQPGNGYQYLSGTSMATPHVSGACALVWSMDPSLTNLQVKDILLKSVDKTLTGQCVSGGRLNVYNAILETKSPWITIAPDSARIGAGESNDLQITFNATNLAPGTYQAEILIISSDPLSPTVVPVTMVVNPEDLQVSPAEGMESTGTEGGPFTPTDKTYTLTNIGTEALNWQATVGDNWISAEPAEGMLGPSESVNVNLSLASQTQVLEPNIYKTDVTFTNLNSGAVKVRPATLTIKPPDYFTEVFSGTNDIQNKIFTFIPNGSKAYYEMCREKVTEFPTNPAGGTNVTMADDDYAEVDLTGGKQVLFYGTKYDRFYIGSNGYITFGVADTNYAGTLESHFELPRISGIFTDLSPLNKQTISYKQLDDRIAVTFNNIAVYGDKTKLSSFQIEMFYVDGKICISYLKTNATDFVAGLSRGRGLPPAFYLGSDLSTYPICWPFSDISKDYTVNFEDFAMLTSHWLETDCNIPYWCGRSDLNYSGATDINDLAEMADNWLVIKNWWMLPRSHWKFDDGTGTIAIDSGDGGHNGTIYGAQWAEGTDGGALDFDAINDYVDFGDIDEFEFGDKDFTIALWFKTEGPHDIGAYQDGIGMILSKYNFSIGRQWSFQQNAEGRVGFATYYASNSGNGITSTNSYVGNWTHCVAVRRGAKQYLYFDGVQDVNGPCQGVQTGRTAKVMAGAIFNYEDGIYYQLFNGKIDDIRIYNRGLTDAEIQQIYDETRTKKATKPVPEDAAVNVSITQELSWLAGRGAESHNVYFGTVNPPPFVINQTTSTFAPVLDYSKTYYWRIDEIGSGGTIEGDVWSFTTVPPLPDQASFPIPEDGTSNISLNQDLTWCIGSGATSHDVYFGTLNPPPFIGNQTETIFDTGTMNSLTTYYWRIDEKNAGGTTTGAVWSFTTVCQQAGFASNPLPVSGATNLDPNNVNLSWAGGSFVLSHDVYLGTSFAAVNDANNSSSEFKGNQTAASYNAGVLDVNTTYYWRIDEKNNCGSVKGSVWNFKTWKGFTLPTPRTWWKFDEASGTVAHDGGTGAHNGTVYGNPQWVAGQVGGCLDFDAAGDYVDFGDVDEFEFGNNDFSVAFWFKTEGTHDIGGDLTGNGMLVSKYSFSYGREWFLQQAANGKISFTTYLNDSGEGIVSTNSYSGQWVHCVGVRQGNKKYLYFNGVADVNGPCSGITTGVSTKLLVGAIHSSMSHFYQYFNGKIDDVRIYNKALSATEVQALYNQTK